jgi:hypothetical protein
MLQIHVCAGKIIIGWANPLKFIAGVGVAGGVQ